MLNDHVYAMDRGPDADVEANIERVLCFDRRTGASVWVHEYPCAYSEVNYPLGPRASVTISEGKAYSSGTMGHLHCFDAVTGAVIWAKSLREDYDVSLPVWGLASSPLIGALDNISHLVVFE